MHGRGGTDRVLCVSTAAAAGPHATKRAISAWGGCQSTPALSRLRLPDSPPPAGPAANAPPCLAPCHASRARPRAAPQLARPASATQLGVRGVAHLAPHASPATHRTKATQAWIPKTAWAATGADPLFLLEQPSPAIVDHEMLSQSKAQAPALRTTPAHFPQPVVRASAAASGRRAY
jgi:hypothetical protein